MHIKDGGHRHDKGDPEGVHGHKQYEVPKLPRKTKIDVDATFSTKKVGDKIISTRVVKTTYRLKKRKPKSRKSKRR